jgi:hypothetical protein
MKLGSWLIARGKISGVQLKRALLDQSFYGGCLSSSLMKLGYVDERSLGEYLAETFQVPYAPAARLADISPETLRMIPAAVAARHHIIPLAVEGRKLLLAMMNPRDILVLDEVAFLTGLQVEAWVSSENFLLDALEKFYQIPRSVRQTIPLAEQAEEAAQADSGAPRPIPPSAAAPPAPSAPEREELGLDGRPLSASAEVVEEIRAVPPSPEVQARGAVPSRPLPRSIEEWRSEDAATQQFAPPALRDMPAAPAETASGAVEPLLRPARTSPAARPPLTLVPTAPPASVEEVSLRLKNSLTRDEIFDAVVGFSAARFVRTALFVVMQEKVIGWGGRGDGFDPARIRATTIPFSVPSIFSYFRMGSDFYFGPVPDLPANRQFYRDLSAPSPDLVLLIPILIKGRLIALLYGDNGTGRREEPDIALFRRVAQKASLALEILILRNKIEMI